MHLGVIPYTENIADTNRRKKLTKTPSLHWLTCYTQDLCCNNYPCTSHIAITSLCLTPISNNTSTTNNQINRTHDYVLCTSIRTHGCLSVNTTSAPSVKLTIT